MLERSVVEIELSTSAVMPALVNPSLVGANKVNGPVLLSVAVRLAFTSALSSVLKSASAATTSEIVLDDELLPSLSSFEQETMAVTASKQENNAAFEIRLFMSFFSKRQQTACCYLVFSTNHVKKRVNCN